MLLVQDQYARKNFDTELQDASKQLLSESDYEEELVTSGNDTEAEDNILYTEVSDLQEGVLNPPRKKLPKNVRFEGQEFNYVLDTSETSSFDNEYLDMECGYADNEPHRRSSSQEPEAMSHKQKEHFRVPIHKPKCRTAECGNDKRHGCDRRTKSNPERSSDFLEGSFNDKRPISWGEYNDSDRHRAKRKDHRCGRAHRDADFEHEATCRKTSHRLYKFEDEVPSRQRHGDCCDHCPLEEGKIKKGYVKMRPVPTRKHVHHMVKDPMEMESKTLRKHRLSQDYDTQFAYHTVGDRYCQDEYCDHHEHGYPTKTKKKILESVQEQQEQFSDTTYKIPCNKYSNQTIPGELTGLSGKKSSEKLTNSSQSEWLYYGTKGNESALGEKVQEASPRIHKMRSRRTRMNRLKNGWKKAFVQTVRDGSRNERVGVIVLGSKGPEFYSKNSKKTPNFVPFRKSKSFLDGPAKSFEVMTIDCKNVFLSSSEPGPRTNYAINDLVCPEDDAKVEEKMAKFSKNINDIVKSEEEKFYKALQSNEFQETRKQTEGIFKGAGEGTQQVDEKGREHLRLRRRQLSDNQFDFRKGRSTIDAIGRMRTIIDDAVSSGGTALVVSLDISNAFNSLPWDRIRDAMIRKEIPEYLRIVLEDNLSERDVVFTDRHINENKNSEEVMKIKYSPFPLSPFDHLSSRVLRKPEMKITKESKAMADALNEQARQYRENQSNLKNREETFLEELKELREKYPPKEISQETVEGNLSLWGMKLDHLSETTDCLVGKQQAEDAEEKEELKEKDPRDKEKMGKDEMSQSGSAKSTEQISLNKQRRKKYYESTLVRKDSSGDAPMPSGSKADMEQGTSKRTSRMKKRTKSPNVSFEGSQKTDLDLISAGFRELVENGCAMSQEESQNLQSKLYNAEDCINDAASSSSSEATDAKINGSPESPRFLEVDDKHEARKKEEEKMKKREEGSGSYLEEVDGRKVSKIYFDERDIEPKEGKKTERKDRERKTKIVLEDKMRVLREALPSIAAKNEAAHLKQLKKYIDRFIDRVEASTASEFRWRKETRSRPKECASTDSSEVKVDARKILDFVSNPFKKISSDVTINIARKLTDALVQDKSTKSPRTLVRPPRPRKPSGNDTDEEGFLPQGVSSGSGKWQLVCFVQGVTLVACGVVCVLGVLCLVRRYK